MYEKDKVVVLVTGGFDPIHSGHISYLQAAKAMGDILVVGVNSDAWLERKKGRAFMPLRERGNILKHITGVDFVIDFDDSDGSARRAIEMVRASYPQNRIIFANGGDRTSDNIPEMSIQDPNIDFKFGVGGEDKKNSSSWILEEWKAPKTNRPWGYYRVLHEDGPQVKVKELTVEPGTCLSMQRHSNRSEFWFVSKGEASVYTIDDKSTDIEHLGHYSEFQHLHISRNQWHRLCNETAQELRIVEIQYGDDCQEDDIERK
jgi:D-beta-D-heptose 7-phosphate kinase/D-beta-D-heptose 1-phosphate adenosyltransferase